MFAVSAFTEKNKFLNIRLAKHTQFARTSLQGGQQQ